MNASSRISRSERGAVLVQIAISILVLMAFNVFVVDYGAFWVSRRQAQNAADAGALAGAVALGYDDFGTPDEFSPAGLAADVVANANPVWRVAGMSDVTFPECPASVTGRCVRVDVHRTVGRGNPVETFFGPIIGIDGQSVSATATAAALNATGVTCLRPWAMADDWVENVTPGEFNHYDAAGNPLPAGSRDEYTPPSSSQSGLITVSGDFGVLQQYTVGLPFTSPITRPFVLPLNLPGPSFPQNMTECNDQPIALNETLPVIDSALDMVGPLQQAFDQDPDADWNDAIQKVVNSCAPGCDAVSPRLFAIALYDPKKFQYGRATGNWSSPLAGSCAGPCVSVSNIVGFFIRRVDASKGAGPSQPHGHYVKYPGITVDSVTPFVDDGSWLVTTRLVR